MGHDRTPAQQLLRACAGTAAVAGVLGACRYTYEEKYGDTNHAALMIFFRREERRRYNALFDAKCLEIKNKFDAFGIQISGLEAAIKARRSAKGINA